MRREKQLLRIVKERIDRLFELAREEIKRHPERSRRYVSLARKLSTRYNVRLPKGIKSSFCKKCNGLFVPGHNVKVRMNSREGCVEYRCSCGEIKRMHLDKKPRKA